MSRSYKHFACFKATQKGFKKIANKRVRRSEIVADHKFYKKIFQSWNICDHRDDYSIRQFRRDNESALKNWHVQKYSFRQSLYSFFKCYVWK